MTEQPRSLWADTAPPGPDCPALAGETSAAVCIVGAGFTGLSAALHLAERGIDTVVLDAHEPGWGASGRNGGQVIPGLKQDPDALRARYGEAVGNRLIRFVGEAPRLLFAIARRHTIACDAFEGGWIQPAHSAKGLDTIRRRAALWRAEGADIVEIDRTETARLIGSDHYVGAVIDRRGGSVQPLAFARGLARAAAALGVRIHAGSPATALTKVGGGWVVSTPGGAVRAPSVILATNGYNGALHPALRASVVPVHSFQVATEPLSDNLARTILPEGHPASDTRRLLWYFRKDSANRLLMGGRGVRKDDIGPTDTRTLQAALRALYPQLGEVKFAYHWGRQGRDDGGSSAPSPPHRARPLCGSGVQRPGRRDGHGHGQRAGSARRRCVRGGQSLSPHAAGAHSVPRTARPGRPHAQRPLPLAGRP